MKRIFLLMIMLSSFVALAQKTKFGVKAGLNISNLRGDYPSEIDETKSKIGFHVGGFLDYKINEKLSLQLELLFSTNNGSSEIKDEYYYYSFPATYNYKSFKQTHHLNYLTIPIVVKYAVIKKLHIEFGPQLGILVSAKSDWEHINSTNPAENKTIEVNLLETGIYTLGGATYEIKEKANRFDFGLLAGTSYDLTDKVFLEARYVLGLTTVGKSFVTANGADSWDLKNSVFQFSLGYRF